MVLVLRCCPVEKRIPFFTLLYAGICSAAFLCLALFWSASPSWVGGLKQQTKIQESSCRDYSFLGTGPFSLKSGSASSLMQAIRDELIVVAKNTRPDVAKEDGEVLVRLKTSQKEHLAPNGSLVFLSSVTADDGKTHIVDFSQEPTALALRANVLDKEKALIEVSLHTETKQFVSELSSAFGARVSGLLQKTDEMAISALKKAKWWGFDLFLQNYGGKEYQGFGTKQKLEISEAAQICFVDIQDFLVWDGNIWKNVGSHIEQLKDRTVAKIKSIQNRKMEIEVWDKTGFYTSSCVLDLQTPQRMTNRPDQLPASVRLRTATQVTCTLGGKKRFILRQGDWLLKTEGGWRNLKKNSEIDAYVQHELKGELFVFDKLERDKNKAVLKGHMFDEMRTQMHPINIPIAVDKGK